MQVVFKGRKVEIQAANLNGDPVDAYAETGYWLDTLLPLTDEELDELSRETDFSEECMEYQIDRAEAMADAYSDGSY